MTKFGLFQKNGTECISIYNSTHESLRYKVNIENLAKNYFIAIKRLPEEEFNKLFEVKRISNFSLKNNYDK
jgi:hypothetical protein